MCVSPVACGRGGNLFRHGLRRATFPKVEGCTPSAGLLRIPPAVRLKVNCPKGKRRWPGPCGARIILRACAMLVLFDRCGKFCYASSSALWYPKKSSGLRLSSIFSTTAENMPALHLPQAAYRHISTGSALRNFPYPGGA